MHNSFGNIIFDVGNVLLRWNPAKVIAEKFPPGIAEKLQSAETVLHTHWHDLDRGTLTREEAINLFAGLADIPLEVMREVYFALRDSLDLDPAAYDLLLDLSHSGYTLFCISNMSLDFWEYLKLRYTFWTVFNDIIISAEVRMIKPDKEIFQHAIDRFGIDPRQSIFIDDSLPNITAATDLDLTGILFLNARHCRHRLEEIIGNPLQSKPDNTDVRT
ncbi:MAG: HAD family phosphatase [FCB group bacterium]|nr:HAD family phosphatase [FCB group bacterium]